MTPGEQIAAEAWAAFNQWCDEHDPDGEMEIMEQIAAYSRWCDAGNRVELAEQWAGELPEGK